MGRVLVAAAMAGFFVAVIADVGPAVAIWEALWGLVAAAGAALGEWVGQQIVQTVED